MNRWIDWVVYVRFSSLITFPTKAILICCSLEYLFYRHFAVFLYFLLGPSVAELLGNLMPFESFNLFGPSYLIKILLNHLLSCANISFATFAADPFDFFNLQVQCQLHIHVLLLGLHFFIHGPSRRLDCPDRWRVTHRVVLFLGLIFLYPLVNLLLPEFALSFLCFLLNASLP